MFVSSNFFYDIISALAVSQLILVGVIFATKYRRMLGLLISLFCATAVLFLIAFMSIVETSSVFRYLLIRAGTVAPFLIWMISFSLFTDNTKISPVIILAMAYSFFMTSISAAIQGFGPGLGDSSIVFIFVRLTPWFIMLFFSVHAILMASKGYQTDLIELRRQLRILFICCIGTIVTLIVIATIIFVVFEQSTLPGEIYAIGFFISLLIFNISTFRFSKEALTLASSEILGQKSIDAIQASTPQEYLRIVSSIQDIMGKEKLHRRSGLTISDLADSLRIPEYKVRRAINQTMQFKNFSQFLNCYRIDEAGKALIESTSAISSIALDVGFSSLSSFNKAFKDQFGVTPSKYRSNNMIMEGHIVS